MALFTLNLEPYFEMPIILTGSPYYPLNACRLGSDRSLLLAFVGIVTGDPQASRLLMKMC
jgi:hypothetical protein